jgi:hypothetical protein
MQLSIFFTFGKVQFRSALSIKALTQSLKTTVTFAEGVVRHKVRPSDTA